MEAILKLKSMEFEVEKLTKILQKFDKDEFENVLKRVIFSIENIEESLEIDNEKSRYFDEIYTQILRKNGLEQKAINANLLEGTPYQICICSDPTHHHQSISTLAFEMPSEQLDTFKTLVFELKSYCDELGDLIKEQLK